MNAGTSYYVSNAAGTGGSGTIGSPWKIGDLFTISGGGNVIRGVAMTTLQPGDTLYFRGGTYNLVGAVPRTLDALIWPTHSGTALAPITLRNYPGESVTLAQTANSAQFIMGGGYSADPQISPINYIRVLGFTFQQAMNSSDGAAPADLYMQGTGSEIGWCEIIGVQQLLNDNHGALSIGFTNGLWVHHCNIHGAVGEQGFHYGQGIETYRDQFSIIEDNWIHDNDYNLYWKDCLLYGAQLTLRRNWITSPNNHGFLGPSNPTTVGIPAVFNIYDNVIDGGTLGGGTVSMKLQSASNQQAVVSGCNVYNNLFRVTNYAGTGPAMINNADMGTSLTGLWNNITLYNNGTTLKAWWDQSEALITSGGSAQFSYFDYNVYDGAPTYLFSTNYSLAAFRTATSGMEAHAQTAAQTGTGGIFVDTTAYVLQTAFQTAGRGGGFAAFVGPGTTNNPRTGSPITVAQILDTTRYGPGAMP